MTEPSLSVTVIFCSYEGSGRDERLREAIAEVFAQEQVAVDVILVWKGADPSLIPRIPGVTTLQIGLCSSSEARNIGARRAKHDLICFLDDDTYPVGHDFFQRAAALMKNGNLDFVTCNIRSSGDILAGTRIEHDVVLDGRTIIDHMWEPGLMLWKRCFDTTGFDPTLGISCIHGSSEGFDFGRRLLDAGYRGARIASLEIDHPPLQSGQEVRTERSFFYGMGNGSSLIQHRYYKLYCWQLFKAMARILVSLLRGDRSRAKVATVRSLAMIVGPLIPRQYARIVPPEKGRKEAVPIQL
jgi:hypothetical protein